MESVVLDKKLTCAAMCIGGGIGLILFVVFGILPGSLFGGIAGLTIAGKLFGFSPVPSLFSKLLVAAFMIAGLALTALVFLFLLFATAKTLGYVRERISNLKAVNAIIADVKVKKWQ